ncbi:MAG: hypothetical protein EBU08_06075 [Micrococcales bacterium]|nr:hypothetical protein [Micrococcales bacterium]
MNVFKFITPTGQQVELTGPAGSTYDQALAVFNQQSATGSLTGLRAGDVLNSLIQAKGGLATALSQVTGSITPGTLSQIAGAVTKIPNLPALNPTTISTFVNTPVLAGSTVGPLSTTQVQGLLSSTAASVNQPATEITNEKGLGTYGLTPDQLQQAGLIKPGTAELINQDPATLVSTLSSPTVWTGVGGADSLDSVLANPVLQSAAQQSTLATSYNNLSDLGIVSTTTNNLLSSNTDLGAVVNNAANYGVSATTAWLNNTVGGSEIGQLTTSAIQSVFGINFSTVNQSVSGGGNPLQTGVQTPRGFSNTVNRSVIDASFNSIIGNNKIPRNIFANPSLGIDIRTQATQLSTINQSASILLTQLASTAAGVAALSQIPGADNILSLLKSGQGLVSEIKGAANLLDQAKNLPGVGALLKDVPGSGEVLAGLQQYGTAIFTEGLDALGLDVTSITNFDVSELLGGADQVIEIAQEYAAEAFEFISSFW